MLSSMPFSYNSGIKAVSEKQYNAHLKLYNGYITKVNEISKSLIENPDYLAGANATYSPYRALKKGESFALNGVILHELYFENLGANIAVPLAKTESIIKSAYGSIENFKEHFTACSLAARGWCIFGYEHRSHSFKNILMDLHDEGYIAMAFPIIVADMYEHAYFLDYATDKAAYIKALFENINWQAVEKRVALLLDDKNNI